MKKTLLTFVLCLFAFLFSSTVNAQGIYQLQNADFEAPFYQETSNSSSIVPPGFNSFYSASGSWASTAQAQRCAPSTDVRPGSLGTQSLRLYSTIINIIIIQIRANGNVTTGRINAGNTTANHVDNYNYTDYATNNTTTPPNPIKFCPEMTGTPDSLRFWAKYLPGRNGATNTIDQGRLRVYIHGTGECRDAPQYPSGKVETDYYFGKAQKNFYKEDGGWQSYQVPFEYNGNNIQKNANGNYYVLVSMTTNATPGGGDNNADQVWFDDIEFVYSAWLNDLRVNNVTIENFNKFVLEYSGPQLTGSAPYAFPYQPANFTAVKESPWATVAAVVNVPGPTGDADRGYTSILVTANDGSTKEYKIHYGTNFSSDANITGLSYTLDNTAPIQINGVNPSITTYSVTLANPDEAQLPKIRPEDVVLSHPAATVYNIVQPKTVDNSQAIITIRAENYTTYKNYTVNFSKPVSSNKNLSWIKVAGIEIPNFHPDTLEYSHIVTDCVTANGNIPAVTAETSSIWATIGYVTATTTAKTTTITVTAQNGDTKVYKVNFIFGNNNASLLGYRVVSTTSTNRNNVFSSTNFVDSYSTSHTSIPTLSASTTSGQQVCGASTIAFPAPAVFYPDTNYIVVTAQDGATKQTYKSVLKNTNCYLKVTSGSTAGLKYKYNGVTYNVPVVSGNNSNNNNLVNYNITLPVGPNVPAELFDADPQAPTVDTLIYNQPATRAGIGSVTVYAADGNGTNKTYQVTFTPTLSTDATLKSLTYNDLLVPGFSPATEFYSLILPSSATEVPELKYIPNFQWLDSANIVYTPAGTLDDTATIEVTCERGDIVRTYRVAFERVEQEKDAYLVDIRYDNHSIPGFNPTIYYYMVDIPYSDPTPPATVPIASSPTAHILPSFQLTTPPYTQEYLIYSEDFSVMKIYKIDFNRIKNTNSALADIKINGVSLQNFNSEEFEYEFELDYTEMNAPVVTAIPAFQYASVVTTQIDTVIGTVTIFVTAEDDAYTSTYTISFTRELSPVKTIESLVYEYDNETYTYPFPVDETEVTIKLPMETLETPFILDVLLADNRATFEIVEQPDETNELTATISVTAEDATDETYSITFERTLSPNTLLTGIFYDDETVPGFDPATFTYSIMLDWEHSEIPFITATAAWQGTVINIVQPNNPFGTGTVTVTSEDGNNIVTYVITFLRKGNPLLVDLSYNLDGAQFPILDFSPTTFEYNVLLPIGTTATPELVYFAEDNRCIITFDQPDSPHGTGWVHLVTWNEDASVTYTVTFAIELSTNPELLDLRVDGVTVPNFNPNILNYNYPIYTYGEEPYYPVVTAFAKEVDASVHIEDITEYPGTASATVTAGNPDFTRTYKISFRVEAGDNNNLEMIYTNGVPLVGFNKNIHYYERELPKETTQLPIVTATPEDARATVIVLPENPQIGDTITIFVEAINGNIAKYQLFYYLEKNHNAYLQNIFIDWEPLAEFLPYIPDYTVTLPANYAGRPLVTVELQDPTASFVIEEPATIPVQTTITVTAEDGTTTFTYTLTFERKPNSINTFGNETEISVYPNPSSLVIHFDINSFNSTLEIFSMEGKRIDHRELQSGVNAVNIEHLQNGIYFYKILRNNEMLGAGKFVKN